MSTKRLFTGTFIDKTIFADELGKIIGDFEDAIKGKWVEAENLHFTYQFIGDFDARKIPLLKKELEPLICVYNSELIFDGLGCFPNQREPKILFAGIKNNDGKVLEIHRMADEILKKFDYAPERRRYTPHVTLMRIKESSPVNFSKILDNYRNQRFGSMSQFRFSLVESSLTANGPVYKEV